MVNLWASNNGFVWECGMEKSKLSCSSAEFPLRVPLRAVSTIPCGAKWCCSEIIEVGRGWRRPSLRCLLSHGSTGQRADVMRLCERRAAALPGTATLITRAVSPSTRGHEYALAVVRTATRCRTCRAAILVRPTDMFAWIPRRLRHSMRCL